MKTEPQTIRQKLLYKIRRYCDYQPRSSYEVKQKLYSAGLYKNEVEQITAQLIEENYLNEERFASLFASGKFRINKWGRKKIEYELKQKQVSTYNIRTAVSLINGEEYSQALNKLAAEKWKQLKKEHHITRSVKTLNYLMQKGYEYNLAQEAIQYLKIKL
jgi:regulatory protein